MHICGDVGVIYSCRLGRQRGGQNRYQICLGWERNRPDSVGGGDREHNESQRLWGDEWPGRGRSFPQALPKKSTPWKYVSLFLYF